MVKWLQSIWLIPFGTLAGTKSAYYGPVGVDGLTRLRVLFPVPFSEFFFYLLVWHLQKPKSVIILECNFIFWIVIPKTKQKIPWRCRKQQPRLSRFYVTYSKLRFFLYLDH